MKSVRALVVVFVVITAAVAGVFIWNNNSNPSESRTTSRQRNTVYTPSRIDTSWGNNGFSLMTQPSNIEVADTATTLNGVTYSVGTMATANGSRAVVFRTVDGKTYDVKYAINPLKEKLAGFGTIRSSIGRKISVDNAGNVWVVFTAVASTGVPTEYWAVTQLTPTLDYWGTVTSAVCSSVCGAVYAPSISIYDIQANFDGNKILIATSIGMDLFNVTAGRPLPLGTVTLTNGPGTSGCSTTPSFLADDGSEGFVAVSMNYSKNVVLINYDGLIADCESTIMLTSVSSISVTSGIVSVFGEYFDYLGFVTFYVGRGALYFKDFGSVDVSEIVGRKQLIIGQTISFFDLTYGAITVQGDTTETYLVEIDGYSGHSNIFASIGSSTTTAISSSHAPLLTVSKEGMVVASSYTDASSIGTAIAVRYTLGDGSLLSAPTFPTSEQNISVTYGQSNSVPFARAVNASSYSLDSGSLPDGMSITTTGDLVGTPLSVGYYTAHVKATNDAGSSQTVLYIRSAPTAPGAPTILGVQYGSPVTLIGYVEGRKGSNEDVVSAHFKGPDGKTINQQCLNGTCVVVNRDLRENTDVSVSLTQSNEAGTTEAVSSIVVHRTVLPEPPTGIAVKGGPLRAFVKYVPSADMHGIDALTTIATVTRSSDKSVVMTYSGCSPDSCILEGLPAGTGYTVTLTIVTEMGNVTSQPSSEFTVTEPVASKDGPQLATENITLLAHEDFVLPLVATGLGDITFDVNYEDMPFGAEFDSETNSITGSVVAGTYDIRYSATDINGTTEGIVTIVAAPSQLRAPGILPSFNTYDQKFSVFPFYKRKSDAASASSFEWTSTVTVNGKESTISGSCSSGPLCTLRNAIWGQDLTLTIKALPIDGSGDTESDINTFIVHVPDLPPAVPTGKFSLERMPDTSPNTAVVMGHIRMKPSMKFPLSLGSAATVQVDATTSCDIINQEVVLRLEGPRNGCSVDPFVKVLKGDETLASDDDGGVVQIPSGTDEYGNELITVYNMLSSRMSDVFEAGDYTIEATTFTDLYKDDMERADASDVEYDLWLTVITTPEEADRLMKTIDGTPSTASAESTVTISTDTSKKDVIPTDLQPAKSNVLSTPAQNAGTAVSASVVSLRVEAGAGKLDVTPSALGSGEIKPVTIKATPGGRECTTASGDTCTITGLSPWMTYTLNANVAGNQNMFTTTARTALQWKSKAKVKVSSLGLTAAAKQLQLTIVKGSIRVSGNCTLNASRTTVLVNKAGTCTISARTAQKAKPKVSGTPLTATAVIK